MRFENCFQQGKIEFTQLFRNADLPADSDLIKTLYMGSLKNDHLAKKRIISCNDHGYNSINDPGFCIQFKLDYDAQWLILALAK